MRTKVRVLVNIFIEERSDESLFQFNRVVPIYYYHAIRAFVKNCPLIKNATGEDLQTVKLITIVCSNDENAMTILHGLEGCAKNSFFDELTRKKANAVDMEAIKITLNSVYGKGAFNRDTDSVSEEFNNLKAVDAEERRIKMENKIIVPVYIYYGDDRSKYSHYLYNSFRARRIDCDRIYNSLVDGPYVCAYRSSKNYGDAMVFYLSCQNKDDALKVFERIEELNEEGEPVSKVDDMLVSTKDTTPKNNSISSEIDYIAKNLDDTDLFLQMAEEAAELSQACLKYVRAHKGNNPTKDSADVYLKNILEELTDVRVSADVLNIEEDIDTYINKIHRWADRIRCKNEGDKK